MTRFGTETLPLAPLLAAYSASAPSLAVLCELSTIGPRCTAILSARRGLLDPAFLDGASDSAFREAVLRFYLHVVQPPLHAETLGRKVGVVRHGIGMILRGRDSLPMRLAHCLNPGGAAFVAGLGPSFWSAIVQGLDPYRHPGWTPTTLDGFRRIVPAARFPQAGPAVIYGRLLETCERLLRSGAIVSALHFDHFLSRVANTTTRILADADDPMARCRRAIDRTRATGSLREQLKVRGATLARARTALELALASCDGPALLHALGEADPDSAARAPLDAVRHAEALTLWIGRLWESPEPALPGVLDAFWKSDAIPGAGLWLPPAVLHLRDSLRFPPWSEAGRSGFASIEDGLTTGRPDEDYALYREGITWLVGHLNLHPLEVPRWLRALAPQMTEPADESPAGFGGFGPDTFAFLAELAEHNDAHWMARQRARYRFGVRQPLVELCRSLARRYVEPVLRGRHGWDFDTVARPGHALTSIARNAYGRGDPYNTSLWITFRPPGTRREQPQLFVKIDARGLRYGLRLGRAARAALHRLRDNLIRHGDWIFAALQSRGAFVGCTFGPADHEVATPIDSAESLLALAERSFEVRASLHTDDPRWQGEALVGEILLTFDRLLPLLAAALEDDAGVSLRRLGIAQPEPGGYTPADFLRATFLDPAWLERATGLLTIKKQLILQGVPGTGKTHVARCLARLLTQGRDECVRLVQFHPAYSYEEFVEGIKVRTVEINGRMEPTYPVEEGLLCSFAEQAAASPSRPHVLIVDEINRGNLPRIFGELLYLLEYREQAVVLPYSRRRFQLPANLYLLGTMNAADRSVALVDQALRRRFSFLEMAPSSEVLAAWLRSHPPSSPAFAQRVLDLFDRLNARLSLDLGPTATIGHSVFMVPGLDDDRLRLVWTHQVLPLVLEHVAGRADRLEAYTLERIEADPPRRRSRT